MPQDHPSESDLRFGQLVVSQGFATSEQVRECLRLRFEYSQGKVDAPRLGDLLLSRGYLTAEQCERIRRETSSAPEIQEPSFDAPEKLPAVVVEAQRTHRNVMGRYVKVTPLGEGGMGQVWRAWDRDLSRWVALKLLKYASLDELGRFQREARTVAKLAHPNVAAVYDVGEHLGRPYIAMQFIDGQPLNSLPRTDPKSIARLVRDACLGIHCAHENGIIHRDLKPHNIIVEMSGPMPQNSDRCRLRPFVVDFGLAKDTAVTSPLSVQGNAIGTPPYMSPEQARGRVDLLDVRTDVYSLGATLFDVLTGRPPFQSSDPYALMRMVVESQPPRLRALNPAVDRDLEAIVDKCLEKAPSRRYPSAAELAKDLDRYLAGEPVLARSTGAVYRLQKRIRKYPVLIAVLVCGGLAAVALRISGTAEHHRIIVANEADRDRALRAAELCRRAGEGIMEAKTLWRVRTSRRDQWEHLLAEAEVLLEEALRTYPRLPACHHTRGELLEAGGRYREAVLAYDQALKLDPGSSRAWYSLGLCNIELFNAVMMQPGIIEVGRPEEEVLALRRRHAEPFKHAAWEAFQNFAALRGTQDGMSASARCAQAAFALAEGRPDEAERTCNALLTETQTDERVWLLKAKASCFQGDFHRARQTLDTLLEEVMPQLAEAYHLRGWVRQKTNDHEGAVSDCSRALELNPSFAAAYVTRAWARAGLNDGAGAEIDAAAAIAADPACAPAHYARGWAREQQGDLKGAIEDYGALVALNPTYAPAYTIRGWALEQCGDRGTALLDYQKALSLGRGESRDHANCGRLRLQLEDWPGAIHDLSEAIRLAPSEARLRVERGRAYLAIKDLGKALRDFRDAEQEDETLGPELAPLIRQCEGVVPSP